MTEFKITIGSENSHLQFSSDEKGTALAQSVKELFAILNNARTPEVSHVIKEVIYGKLPLNVLREVAVYQDFAEKCFNNIEGLTPNETDTLAEI